MSNKSTSAAASVSCDGTWLDLEFHAFNLPNLDFGKILGFGDDEEPDSYLNIYVGEGNKQKQIYCGEDCKMMNQKNPVYVDIRFTRAQFLQRAGLTNAELKESTTIRIDVMDYNISECNREIGRVTTSLGGLRKAAREYLLDKSRKGGCLPLVLTTEAEEYVLTRGEGRIMNPRLQVAGFQPLEVLLAAAWRETAAAKKETAAAKEEAAEAKKAAAAAEKETAAAKKETAAAKEEAAAAKKAAAAAEKEAAAAKKETAVAKQETAAAKKAAAASEKAAAAAKKVAAAAEKKAAAAKQETAAAKKETAAAKEAAAAAKKEAAAAKKAAAAAKQETVAAKQETQRLRELLTRVHAVAEQGLERNATSSC